MTEIRVPKQEQEQATTDITEPAPGVVRLQLPIELPGLGHVNCYVIEDERGIAVVDPGLPGDDAWRSLVDRLGRAGYRVTDVHTAIVTHSHFDHFGGSSRLAVEAGADILTHELFRDQVRLQEAAEPAEAPDMLTDDQIEERLDEIFGKPLPWGSLRTRPSREHIEQWKEMGRFTRGPIHTPEPTITVDDAQVIRLGRRDWVALHTPGHTSDHLCLFDPEFGTLLSGDHVLPTITPHISGLSEQPDPLAEFFDSLRRMEELDGVHHVLPAHGHPFTDLAGRAADIRVHHEHRLDVVRESAQRLGDGTVTDYMRLLFSERAWGDMAESETYAHLEHLKVLGELHRETREGHAHYLPA